MNNSFTIEIEVTSACNFRCAYCFEKDKLAETFLSESTKGNIIQFIEGFLQSETFKTKYKSLKIGLWGGEPTLDIQFIKYLIDHFKDDSAIYFFMYTNGNSNLLQLESYIKSGKLSVQISYDGKPIQDKFRKRLDRTITTEEVNETISYFIDNKIPFGTKSTLPPSEFESLDACWDDFKTIHDRAKTYTRVLYAPTVDYYHLENIKDRVAVLYTQLIKIAKKEIPFFKENGYFLLNWFNENSRSCCGVGNAYFMVGMDELVYLCHGCLYQDCKSDFVCGHIKDPSIYTILEDRTNKHKEINNKRPECCSECICLYCSMCNCQIYAKSLKKEFDEKWIDYISSSDLCTIYKKINEVSFSMKALLRESTS